MTTDTLPEPRIVPRDEWLKARLALLAEEKEFTRARDALAARRREMPWTKVEKAYVFDGRYGPIGLEELFGRHGQLIVYHFMFAPEAETGCKSCSFWADHFDGMRPHLAARDTAFAAVSRAPLHKLAAQANRLGWGFPWVSSGRCSFNQDYDVSFEKEALDRGDGVYNYEPLTMKMHDLPGVSVFARNEQDVFHTYSAYARGIDFLNATYNYLDLTPKGRNEDGLPWPMAWVRLRDDYAA